jgi:hypothetical protein
VATVLHEIGGADASEDLVGLVSGQGAQGFTVEDQLPGGILLHGDSPLDLKTGGAVRRIGFWRRNVKRRWISSPGLLRSQRLRLYPAALPEGLEVRL